jgi:DNA polymerase III epsilon subunit-like protein
VTDADASGQAGEPANSGESTESPAGVGGETAQADGGETSSNSGETASDAGAPPAESPDGDEGGGPENVRKIVLRVATSGAEADDDDRVIEVAAVEIVGGKLTGNVFHRQVDPATPIDEAATARHGLTNESVDGAPSFVSMAADLAAFLEDAELVFWDWQREMGALEGEFDRVEMEIDRESGADVPELRPPSDHELVDLKDLAHELHPNGPSDLPGLFEMHDVQAQPLAEGQRPNALLEARGIASLYLALVAAGASRDREQEQEEPQESRPEPSSAV